MNKTMENKNETRMRKPKFSILLKQNDGIIIERFFSVKEFNPESILSLDLNYVCDWVKEQILYSLKKESMRIMWLNYDEYAESNIVDSGQKQERKFYLELRYGRTLINTRELDVTNFPKEVIDNVFLKEEFQKYIQELTSVLSIPTKELSRKYLKQNLFDFSNNIRPDYRKIKNTFNSFKHD